MSEESRSPLKGKPLRSPGQSVEEAIQRALDDELVTPYIIFVLAWVLALMEWVHFGLDIPPSPWHMTALAIAATVFAIWKIRRARPSMRNLQLGRDGERVVGQYLERLREQGYHVYHDVLGDSFNVDHVLIGPSGVFSIETKTWSRPVKGEPKIVFNGEQIKIGEKEPDRNPVTQARAQANWLSRVIAESTGKKFAVRPVILFPGWFVDQPRHTRKEVWVLEPKALPDFLAKENVKLNREDINLVSSHLSRFIRSEEARR